MATDEALARGKNPVWLVVMISGLIGLFYAFVVWNAVVLLVNGISHPLGLNPYGWFVYLAAVAFPLIAFGAAFALGWRRRPWEFALVLVTGLGLAAVFWMNIFVYGVTSFALFGG
jgi:hypothetical protein